MTRTISSFMLALIFATAFTQPTLAQERRQVPAYQVYGEPANEAQKSDIAALLAAYRAAWSAQDTQALIALHSSDTEWINAYARMFQGAEPLSKFLEERLFPAFDSAVSIGEMENLKQISLRYIGDDAAIIHMYTDGNRGKSQNAGEAQRRTHMHLVLECQNKEWRIVHTAIMDAR